MSTAILVLHYTRIFSKECWVSVNVANYRLLTFLLCLPPTNSRKWISSWFIINSRHLLNQRCNCHFFFFHFSNTEIVTIYIWRGPLKLRSSCNGALCSNRRRSAFKAPLDVERSLYIPPFWSFHFGSWRARGNTQHRISSSHSRWNVYLYRGKFCWKTRAVIRVNSQRCIANYLTLLSSIVIYSLS